MDFPKQYRIRIKDHMGELHTILAYGENAVVAEKNGLLRAKRLLKDENLVVKWVRLVK